MAKLRPILIASAAVALLVAAGTPLLSDKQTDQVQRDLTRIFSEIYQRAASHAATGEVVRPEFASTKIDLRVPDLSDGWTPSCQTEIATEPSDPRDNLQALILVPRDRISADGAEFTVFAFFVGAPFVHDLLFADPPDWLVQPAGGYATLDPDLSALRDRSAISVSHTQCADFSFSVIKGAPR